MITTWLGWITVAIGCFLLTAVMYVTRLMLGLPLEGGSIEGLRFKLIAWIAIVIVLVPITFYVGMVVVYGAYGILMFLMRRFTWQQALEFAWGAKYPSRWYKSDA